MCVCVCVCVCLGQQCVSMKKETMHSTHFIYGYVVNDHSD